MYETSAILGPLALRPFSDVDASISRRRKRGQVDNEKHIPPCFYFHGASYRTQDRILQMSMSMMDAASAKSLAAHRITAVPDSMYYIPDFITAEEGEYIVNHVGSRHTQI